MLLLIEFARTTIDNNECIVLYFEPVFDSFFFQLIKFRFSFFFKKCDDVLNYPIGYTDLAVYDPEIDLVCKE